jgi:hypothetical protein
MERTNKQNSDYEKVVDGFAKAFKSCKTYSQLNQKIYAYLYKRYGKKVSKEKLKAHADDFAESVALKLNIPQM